MMIQSSRELLDSISLPELDFRQYMLTRATMAKDMTEIAVITGGISKTASVSGLAHNGKNNSKSQWFASDIFLATYSIVVTSASKGT
jgi:hypothetical protein